MLRTPKSENVQGSASGRDELGRRRYLAMLLVVLGGLVIGCSAGKVPGSDAVTVRGPAAPLHRQAALSGALRFERAACPVPSRVGGQLRLSSESVSPARIHGSR
ncbi:MAG: hypothetical protein DHS20C21_10520 [Gemmatimonadota bacterium]|nr:MAG: hypothetical protein DHS20C21_10520 [Gemmatimonadota bacterium]